MPHFDNTRLTARNGPGQNAAMVQLHSLPVIIRRLPLWLRVRVSGPQVS
jgi:hypothetical protein